MFDMFTAARQLAAQYRELFEALTAMGFTDPQAMTILVAIIGAPNVK